MIKSLYKDNESCTLNCGFTSKYFPIQRSLRQGCPLSAPCFLVLVEVLGQKIRQSDITGLSIRNHQKNHGQYADDLWMLIDNTQKNFDTAFDIINKFSDKTGLKLNYNKTQVMRISSLRNSCAEYYSNRPLIWSDTVKILGIKIYPKISDTITNNYDILFDKMLKVMNNWSNRSLTVLGKIQIINTLVAPLATQFFAVLPSPENSYFKKLNTEISKFIWDGRSAKIAFDKLTYEYAQGGLKLVNFWLKDKSLKATWVQELITTKISFWKTIAFKVLPMPPAMIFELNIKNSKVSDLKISNRIWSDIVKAWSYLNFEIPTSRCEIAKQNIWFNGAMLSQLTPNSLLGLGIIYVQDLFDQNGKIMSYEQLCDSYKEKINFLDVIKVQKAIPKKWKVLMEKGKITNGENAYSYLDKINRNVKAARWFYITYLQKKHPERQL